MVSLKESRKFLDPKAVARLSNYRLLARLIVEGFYAGLHRGPRHAFSLEYSRHRNYYPGDPLKLVDWKLFGRTEKFFVRQYEEETNLAVWLLVDISQSMVYRGEHTTLTKLRYASYLAAALAYLLQGQGDLAGLILFDDRPRKIIPPSATQKHLNRILCELQNIEAGEKSNFEEAARLVAQRIKKRSLVVLFSDLLARPENVEKTLKYFLRPRSDLVIFQILSFEELKFPFRKFGLFEDLETRSRILMQPEIFQNEYLKQMHHYLGAIKKSASKLRASYEMLETTTPFDRALLTFLESRQKMN